MPRATAWSTAASTSSPSFSPHAAKMAVENFSPRPELPRGFTPRTTYPWAAKTCQSRFAKSWKNCQTGPPWIRRSVG